MRLAAGPVMGTDLEPDLVDMSVFPSVDVARIGNVERLGTQAIAVCCAFGQEFRDFILADPGTSMLRAGTKRQAPWSWAPNGASDPDATFGAGNSQAPRRSHRYPGYRAAAYLVVRLSDPHLDVFESRLWSTALGREPAPPLGPDSRPTS